MWSGNTRTRSHPAGSALLRARLLLRAALLRLMWAPRRRCSRAAAVRRSWARRQLSASSGWRWQMLRARVRCGEASRLACTARCRSRRSCRRARGACSRKPRRWMSWLQTHGASVHAPQRLLQLKRRACLSARFSRTPRAPLPAGPRPRRRSDGGPSSAWPCRRVPCSNETQTAQLRGSAAHTRCVCAALH